MTVKIITGDCRDVMRAMEAESVDCIVTSPPYWGLRSYLPNGHDDKHRELGLEATLGEHIAAMVLVFREARRVLKKTGTVWLNYGSVYAAAANGRSAADTKAAGNDDRTFRDKPFSTVSPSKRSSRSHSDVPAYGSDGKAQLNWCDPGSACSDPDDERSDDFLNHHDRMPRNGGSHEPTAPRLSQTDRDSEHPDSVAAFVDASPLDALQSNTRALFRRDRAVCVPLATASGLPSPPTSADDVPLFADKAACIDGSAPLASASRIQGKDASDLACQCGSCGICWTNLAITSLPFKPKDLITVPNILALALQADGWWVRSEIVWAKPNPMPESVRDRPTSSHEKIWLLSKSERYFYDAEAIAEDASLTSHGAPKPNVGSKAKQTGNHSGSLGQTPLQRADKQRGHSRRHAGFNDRWDAMEKAEQCSGTRNRRNVWTVPSQPFSEGHFAVFPPALIEPCVLAGCPRKCCGQCGKPWVRRVKQINGVNESHLRPKQTRGMDSSTSTLSLSSSSKGWQERGGQTLTLGFRPSCHCKADTVPGVVLDPFGGSGTTGMVADRLGRNAILIELNAEYAAMAQARIVNDLPLFAEVTV